MRLPNGFGNVSKLPGNRRRPYRARVTIGWQNDELGKAHQKFLTLGYFATREEGLFALYEYHLKPGLDSHDESFEEVYEAWALNHYSKISESNIRGYRTAFQYCQKIHDLVFAKIHLYDLQQVIDQCPKNYPVLRRIKLLFSQMYKYAMQNDICNKDYSQYVDVAQYRDRNPNSQNRVPFSLGEISKLWHLSSENKVIQLVLMMIYSGCRISELLELKKEDVCLEERYFFVRHAKTISGIRYVPIAEAVYPFWQWWYDKSDSCYMISGTHAPHLSYRNFYNSYWKPLMESLHMSHFPHDTRHTCITLMTLASVDDKVIRKIVGHKGQNVTEIVYTHVEID